MRVSAIQTVNCRPVARKKVKETPEQTSDVNFRGAKGAAIGAAAGVGYMVIASALSGPFFPLTATVLATGAISGALAGNGFEEEFKSDKNDKDEDED